MALKHPPSARLAKANLTATHGSPAYVAVVARHGARYPTRRKMDQAREAAAFVCELSHLDPAHSAKRWCVRLLESLEGKEGGATAPLGVLEQRELGRLVASRYLATAQGRPRISALVTSKSRTRESCEAFRDGAREVWDHMQEQAEALLDCSAVSDELLRPYLGCPVVQQHRHNVLSSNIAPHVVELARAAVGDFLRSEAGDVPGHVALGLYYACQTDATLLLEQANDAAAQGVSRQAPLLLAGALEELSAACAASSAVLGHMEHAEDIENYNTRGFQTTESRHVLSPLLRRITEGLEAAVRTHAQDPNSPHVDLYFAHDSTLLPLVALMDLLDLGEQASGSGAASVCPFSSRLVVEAYGGGGPVAVHYNDMLVRVFEGGAREWRAAYREQLGVDTSQVCGVVKGKEEL